MRWRCFWAMLAAVAVSAAEYRIEPEFFSNQGAWKRSSHQGSMGRGVMRAKAVEKNKLTGILTLPQGGEYCVWVRTLSFNGNSRKCKIFINKQGLGSFGDAKLTADESNPALKWEKAAKRLTLAAGKLDIEIVPVSPYVRIDSIILTTDANFVPPDNAGEIKAIAELADPDAKSKAVAAAAKKSFPALNFKGKGEPVLVLSGKRPWTGREFGDFLAAAGAKTWTLDSRYLAGEGGSPIRDMLGDAYEPKAEDGITPSFAKLDNYKCVVINNIPAKNQQNIFTPERVALLRKYVENGGTLLLTLGVPETLGDLLPVELGEAGEQGLEIYATRPVSENFAFLPEKWLAPDPFILAAAKKDATVLSFLVSPDGQAVAPYIVEKKIDKGKVVFLNGTYSRYNKVASLYAWAYGRAFMAALVKETASIPMDPVSLIRKESAYPKPRELDIVTAKMSLPEMKLTDTQNAVKIDGRQAIFADGAKLEVSAAGKATLTFAGETKPCIVNANAPQLLLTQTQQKLNSETSEAVDTQEKTISRVVWNFDRLEADGNCAVLHYNSGNGAQMQWIFKSGKLFLDGRTYCGIAQKVKILSAPSQVGSMSCDFKLDLADAICRRMNCYQPPRGYAEMDFSGKVSADTKNCNFFKNAQPFGYLNTQEGIYAGILEKPIPTSIDYTINKGGKLISANMTQIIGRCNAPVEGEFFWHLYSKGSENGHNDYIALWQFARHQLRTVAGLKEFPIRPSAGYTNMATPEEVDRAIEVAGKLGVSYMYVPLGPSAIGSVDSDRNMATYAKIKAVGMRAFPWTAGDYTNGTGDEIYQKHKDWLMRDEKGGIYAYFKNFRVIDLSNKEFLAWYFKKLDALFDAGAGYVYMDMGGQASTNINFSGKESRAGLFNQIPIFRYYHDHGVTCGIEGLNPLVIDNFWYREELYNPMGGKEFAVIGGNPSTHEDVSFVLRYFRMAMYGGFPRFYTDAYAQKFERCPDETAMIDHIAALLPGINTALDFGMPFIRATDCGTTWINEKGGAIFVWDNVKELKIVLPEGFSITKTQFPDQKMRDFKTDDLKNIPSETIFIFERK